MDIPSLLNGTSTAASPKSIPAPRTSGLDEGVAANVAAPSAGGAATLSLSKLASSLSGASLDLFNKLKQNERETLGGLVESGRISGDVVHNALLNGVKQARRNAFSEGGLMFEARNPGLFARADTASADEMLKATGDTLARRKALVSRLEELEKAGQASSDAYGETLRALSGGDAGATGGDMTVNGHPRSNRIVTPYIMKLGDPRIVSDEVETAAGKTLEAAGFSVSSLAGAARSMAEDDVAAMVSEQAEELASIMERTAG